MLIKRIYFKHTIFPYITFSNIVFRALRHIFIPGYRLSVLVSASILFTACASLPEPAPNLNSEQNAAIHSNTSTQIEAPVSQPQADQSVDVAKPSVTKTKSEAALTDVPKPAQKQTTVDVLHIIAVGDMMLGTDFPKNRLPPHEGKHLLAGVAKTLASADVTFGNFEGTLLQGGKSAKSCRKNCYVFRTPPGYVSNLLSAGFDVMSLANNHARDFGEQGRTASMKALSSVGIQHSGRLGDVARWQVKGAKLALIAFAPFGGSHDPIDLKLAIKLVEGLKANNDLVMISMHMGAEGSKATRIPFKKEIFYGEDRGDVVRFSRAMVDAGADLVLGHGPHVPRAIELYRGRLIAYSLGNFCTYYGINVRGINGLAPILSVKLRSNGEFSSGQIISARQIRPNGPTLDPQHKAAKLIAKLTALDFPQTPLEISPNGQIKVTAGVDLKPR